MDNPTPWYHHMQKGNSIYFDPDFNFFFGGKGGWQIFNYDDVKLAAVIISFSPISTFRA